MTLLNKMFGDIIFSSYICIVKLLKLKFMKYKVGDKVRIKSLDWYNENRNILGNVDCGDALMTFEKIRFCGKIVTISSISDVTDRYKIEEDNGLWIWTDEMIEGLVEDEINFDSFGDDELEIEKDDIVWNLGDGKFRVVLPEGYQFVDENGNVINATKIFLEKKKPKYPQSYEECCKVLKYDPYRIDDIGETVIGYKRELIRVLQMLLICRDAYWKIAGEEMGLGKPWEPDYTEKTVKYCLRTNYCRIVQTRTSHDNHPFSFPTEEMRDAFYENFKEDIEKCKELL